MDSREYMPNPIKTTKENATVVAWATQGRTSELRIMLAQVYCPCHKDWTAPEHSSMLHNRALQSAVQYVTALHSYDSGPYLSPACARGD